jgi:hypothetical protein
VGPIERVSLCPLGLSEFIAPEEKEEEDSIQSPNLPVFK